MAEFFSGSKAVSSVFTSHNWETITVDNDPFLCPSICVDILKLTRNDLPELLNFLWFSPVCTTFSRAARQHHWGKVTLKYRRYRYIPLTSEAELSLLFLDKVIEIISWFPGVPFVIENPIGRITHTSQLQQLGHYRYFVNYCDFGFSYSKETYLFSNVWLPFSLKKYKVSSPGLRSIRKVAERSKVPPLLVEEIFKYLFHGNN